MRTRAQVSRTRSTCLRLVLVVCLALLAGCSLTSTTVGRVWQDNAGANPPLGKTLVVALFPTPEFAIPIEEEWARQLRGRGIDAEAVHALLTGKRPPDKPSVVELLKAHSCIAVIEGPRS
jgi:hypothetical protein